MKMESSEAQKLFAQENDRRIENHLLIFLGKLKKEKEKNKIKKELPRTQCSRENVHDECHHRSDNMLENMESLENKREKLQKLYRLNEEK